MTAIDIERIIAERDELLTKLEARDDYIREVFCWTLDNTGALVALIEGRAAVVPTELSDMPCGSSQFCEEFQEFVEDIRLDKPRKGE